MNKPDIQQIIRDQIASNSVILYMKGTPEAPECGFSAAAIKALNAFGAKFAYVNVLQAPSIRERLPSISQWPTFPQLFINGELVGGSDIVVGMAADGTLKEALAAVSDTAS
ncbi:MAG: Grx4 family monothiol glutaredoxin [Pseudomonas sp.]|nr:Grx4 family monothiol glutaredoxin [Pseudomonas sp.]